MGTKITVVTPSFNQGRFIRHTIESVLSQNYENLEYIVIDGGSTDGTIEILEEYKDRLKYISEPDNGQSDAINKGFKMASGDIVAWLNSDDTYEPNSLEVVADFFENHPDIALLYGEGYIIDENGIRLGRFENTIDYNLWMLIHVWDYIMQPTTFFRKDALKKVGFLREELHWVMDWDLWIRLSLNYPVAYLNRFLANSREYGQTKTSTGGFKRLLEIRRLTSHYAGTAFTRGFRLFFFDWLSKQMPGEFLRIKTLNRAVRLLQTLPIPDAEGRCGKLVFFCAAPFQSQQTFNIVKEQDSDSLLEIRIGEASPRRLSYNASGEYRLELELTQGQGIHNMHIRIFGDERIRLVPEMFN